MLEAAGGANRAAGRLRRTGVLEAAGGANRAAGRLRRTGVLEAGLQPGAA
ncbi:MAG: hypothetical protein ABSH05_03005 [Bryobacteraceae bacterium]